jgi:hypothetical protein
MANSSLFIERLGDARSCYASLESTSDHEPEFQNIILAICCIREKQASRFQSQPPPDFLFARATGTDRP